MFSSSKQMHLTDLNTSLDLQCKQAWKETLKQEMYDTKLEKDILSDLVIGEAFSVHQEHNNLG
jgi:hypothetical protein